MPKFLLTNDDGIYAPGLATLERVISQFGSVVTLAPDRPHSGCAHQVTTSRPLEIQQVGPDRYSLDGTPGDCARLGLLHLAPDVDWVLSGINAGGNMGVDVFMSGTVAAAREATLLGYRAMALSQYRARNTEIDWTVTEKTASEVLATLLDQTLKQDEFWNVNFPDGKDFTATPPVAYCQTDSHPLAVEYEFLAGKYHYRGVYQNRKRREESDVDYCFRGYTAAAKVSVSCSSDSSN